MTEYLGLNHIFTSKGKTDVITLKAGAGNTLQIEGVLSSTGLSMSRALSGFYSLVPASTSLVVNVWTKIAGTTTLDVDNYKFTHTNNRLTYTGTITGIFYISYSIALAGSNNNNIQLGISKNGGVPDPSSIILGTTTSGGDLLPLSSSSHTQLSTGDYLECFVMNTTGSNAITASRLSLSILGIF